MVPISLAPALVIALFAFAAPQTASAASATWNTTNGSWVTNGNWNPASAPGNTAGATSTDNATFNSSSGGTVTVDTTRNIDEIYFDTNAGAYTFVGGTLVFSKYAGGIQLLPTLTSTGVTETVNAPITLSTSTYYPLINNSAGDVLDIGGTITNAAANTVTLALEGTNTGSNTVSGAITNNANTGDKLYVVKGGTGSWTLTAANTYLGSTTINGGTLTLDFSGSGAPTSQIVSSTSALVIDGSGALVIKGASGVTNSEQFASTTIGSNFSQNGNLGGAASITLTPNSATSLTVNLGVIGTNGPGNTVNFTLPSSGTVVNATTNSSTNSLQGTGGILEAYSNAAYATINNNDWAAVSSGTLETLTATGGYTSTPSGTVTLTANANYDVASGVTSTTTGQVAIDSLRFNVAQATTITTTGRFYLPGILVTSSSGTFTQTIASSGSGYLSKGNTGSDIVVFEDDSQGELNISALIGTTGSSSNINLTKSGVGLLVLSNTANNYTGVTYLNQGTINIAADGSLGGTPASAVANSLTFNGGVLQLGGAINLNSNRGITINTNGGTFDTNGNNSTYGGIIAGSWGGAFTKTDNTGAGTLTVTGANTYNGATNIQSGTLSINTIANGGIIDSISTTSSSSTAATLTSALASNGTYTISGEPQYIAEGTTFTYTGGTSITLSADALGTGILPANIGTPNALGLSSNVSTNLTIGSATGATLQYTGAAASTDRLFQMNNTAASLTDSLDASGSGALNFTNTGSITYGTSNIAETLNFTGSNTGANTFAPKLSDNGTGALSVTKTGVGTWIATGANTYSGGTTVSGGRFFANNASGSATGTGAVTVTGTSSSTLATLSGNGTISGAVTVNSFGVVAPGATTSDTSGNLKLSSTLTLASASASLSFNLGASNASSLLTVNSGSFSGNVINFNDTTSGSLSTGLYELVLSAGANDLTGITPGGSAGSDGNNLITSGVTIGSGLSASYTDQLEISSNDQTLYLDILSVPEPGTWALLLLGGLALAPVIVRRGLLAAVGN